MSGCLTGLLCLCDLRSLLFVAKSLCAVLHSQALCHACHVTMHPWPACMSLRTDWHRAPEERAYRSHQGRSRGMHCAAQVCSVLSLMLSSAIVGPTVPFPLLAWSCTDQHADCACTQTCGLASVTFQDGVDLDKIIAATDGQDIMGRPVCGWHTASQPRLSPASFQQ